MSSIGNPPQYHVHGWTLIFGNEVIAELDYLHDNQSVHVFKIAWCTDKSTMLDMFRSLEDLSRAPNPDCFLKNHKLSVQIPDEAFVLQYHPTDETVTIRDLSPLQKVPADKEIKEKKNIREMAWFFGGIVISCVAFMYAC